ncbi:MAG: pentapeptide repeat-containing protein [Acidovorax sp.]|uniref:pentapeptide repeat-containing protein n=1 Tax=Acidovorax sp. TaxID=1872122 RepID=UPI0039194D54
MRYESRESLPEGWEEGVLRYCEIFGIHFDGRGPEGAVLDSTFEACSWYWSLFNTANFVGVNFRRCEFSGVSFAGCRFVECTFEDCQFTEDSFGKPCRFKENRWYRCQFVRTDKPVALIAEITSLEP